MSATATCLQRDPGPLRHSPPRHPAPAPAEQGPRARRRALLAILSLLLVLAGCGWLLAELGRHPISSVRIAAEFRHLQRGELEAVIEPLLGGSFFAVDVDAVRGAARALAWVREVSVRRVWPDAIHVAIVEREAAYRWGASGLLEADGTLFEPRGREGFDTLPLLAGPPATHAEVVDLHGELTALMGPLGQQLVELELSARGAWRARLSSGIELVLGREPRQATLRRLARAFPAVLAGQQERIEAIDLRYANGFAVRWKPLAPDAVTAPGSQG